MIIKSVCVIGGAGFLGRHIVRQLAASGVQVRVPTRRRERVKDLILLPTVDVVNADVHDVATLERLVTGCDAVINLVAILNETRSGDFTRVHKELPRKIVNACRERGVYRLMHVSALNASHDAPSQYLRSKAEGEQQIRVAQASGIHTTIFRPSVIFGREDRFLNLFAQMAHSLPAIPLASPKSRLSSLRMMLHIRPLFASWRNDFPNESRPHSLHRPDPAGDGSLSDLGHYVHQAFKAPLLF